MYIFLFFLNYLINNVNLIANQNILLSVPITINSTSYSIVTSDSNNFDTVFAATNRTLDDLVKMNCFIDNYNGGPKYSKVLYDSSPLWIIYIITGLLSAGTISIYYYFSSDFGAESLPNKPFRSSQGPLQPSEWNW